jgi:hypothetical protein
MAALTQISALKEKEMKASQEGWQSKMKEIAEEVFFRYSVSWQ